jgi:hypothetical protein
VRPGPGASDPGRARAGIAPAVSVSGAGGGLVLPLAVEELSVRAKPRASVAWHLGQLAKQMLARNGCIAVCYKSQ